MKSGCLKFQDVQILNKESIHTITNYDHQGHDWAKINGIQAASSQ
jgi:hypothetical protein